MPSTTFTKSLSIGGVTLGGSVTRTADSTGAHEVTLPVAKAGSLTTKTDANTGTVTTSASGHGITDSDVVDVYWDGGMRYGMTVGTVAGEAIPIDGGGGDDLPAQDTAMTITLQTTINATIDGDNVALLGIIAAYSSTDTITNAHVDMQDSGSSTIEEIDLVANEPRTYDITGGDTNVFTGNVIETVLASNGDATNAATLRIGYLQDGTP